MKGSLAVLLVALLATFGSVGCATVTSDVSRTRAAGTDTGMVRVKVFDHSSDIAGGVPAPHPVSWRLSRVEGKSFVAVHESTESSATLSSIAPGKYLFAVTSWRDEKGAVHEDGTEEGFRLAPGESAKVEAVLRDRRRTTVITAVAVGGAALVVGTLYAVFNAFSHISLEPSKTSGR